MILVVLTLIPHHQKVLLPHNKVPAHHGEVPAPHSGTCDVPNAGNFDTNPLPYFSIYSGPWGGGEGGAHPPLLLD